MPKRHPADRGDVVSELAAVNQIAAFGLNGSASTVEVEGEFEAFLIALIGQRLTGLATAVFERGHLFLDDGHGADLLEQHRQQMLGALQLERALLEVREALEAAGIEPTVLKGPAFAHTLYPDPSWRPFADLDLLVGHDDWRGACEVLESLGFERRLPEPKRGFDEAFGKAAVFKNERGLEIDLHQRLVLGPFGLWIDSAEMASHSRDLTVGEKTLRRFDDTGSLLHACVHAALGAQSPMLLPLRDVAQIAQYGEIDWDRFTQWTRRWKLTAVVGFAFERAAARLRWSPPPEAGGVTTPSAPRKERRALQAYVSDRRSRGGTARATLAAIPGVRGKASYLKALLVPDEEFLAARSSGQGPSYRERWKVPLRWLRGRG